ncbi:hypothetical protein ACJMK2_034543 [Sinanodonta woodiana]|uniref:Calcineurin-like phosphoesterase domain-containing protein n=1 Tax=Sinanodonta woodiana TaxID=1069815 RepID=A0ABD3WTQ2_SINWO
MSRPTLFLFGFGLNVKVVCFIIVLVAIIINEFLIYFLQSQRWPQLPLLHRNTPEKEQVLLLVSDPQLQGYEDEPLFPVGSLTRWDSDRYLSKTFSYAYNYVQPDIVIFLGDLFDEGSKAPIEEYEFTFKRFHAIFAAAKNVKKLYLPGDNDIGGEGRDVRTVMKIKRFVNHFEELEGVVKFGFIDYVKMDLKSHGLPAEKVETARFLSKRLTSEIRIIINHETVMSSQKHFSWPVLKLIHPKFIISGHWHKPGVILCDDCMKDDIFSWNIARRGLTHVTEFEDIDLRGKFNLTEILVPTCSYRMGVPDMGYGIAIVSANGHLKYTVLWSPSRYIVLYSYGTVILFISLIWIFEKCHKSLVRRKSR